MAYSIQHHYQWEGGKKKGVVLIGLTDTLEEAEQTVWQLYEGRAKKGEDLVAIHDETGKAVKVWEVQYQPMLIAKAGMVRAYPSSSNPNKSYTAQVNTNGVVSCPCPAWTKGFKKMSHTGSPIPYRHCKHTDMLEDDLGFETEIKGQYLLMIDPKIAAAKVKYATKAGKATGPQAKFAVLVKEYEEAIAVMAALDPAEMYQAAAAVEVAKFRVEAFMVLLEQHGIDGNDQFMAAEAKLEEVRARL
jgi:hypothetical protein